MATETTLPAFVTFTGIDDVSDCAAIVEISHRYPVEWGVLIHPDKSDVALFPGPATIGRFRQSGVRLCAHVCGDYATAIAGGEDPGIDLSGFTRLQVNHGRTGATPSVVRAVGRFAARRGVRAVLQCSGEFPVEETAVDWLYDVSFGEGVKPEAFPPIRTTHPFCGISGGIEPGNVRQLVAERLSVARGCDYWIDMESGVRTAGRFDTAKCRAVCRAVFEPAAA